VTLERKITDCGASRYYSDVGFGELFVIRAGVTYSIGAIQEHFAKRGDCGKYSFLQHLSSDVNAVRDLMNQNQIAMVTGDLGAGKSTTIFGIRRALREEGQEYVHINGHFLNKQAHLSCAIDIARQRGIPVVYDSFDYLFRKNKYYSRTAAARKVILGRMRNFVNDGGGLLVSSHTEPWLEAHMSDDLLDEYSAVCDELGAVSHRVVGYLGDETERRVLAFDITGDNEFTDSYIQYSSQSELPTSRTYRVMKLMARSNLKLLGQQQFDDQVAAIDQESRAKMQAPDDYELCPLPSKL
jgi:hypothetical protein